MELIELLTIPDPANHKLAVQLSFTNAEWLQAMKDIIDIIENERMEWVKHFSKIFKMLNHYWYVQDKIKRYDLEYSTRKYFIYNSTEICLLRDNDSRIKYMGKENVLKSIKKLKHAIG
jgi:hypothetical protein